MLGDIAIQCEPYISSRAAVREASEACGRDECTQARPVPDSNAPPSLATGSDEYYK